MIISPLRAFMATPFTSMLTNSSAIACTLGFDERRVDDAAATVVNHVFKLVAEVLEEALYRPSRRIAERADRVALDAIGDVEEQIELLAARRAGKHTPQEAVHPAGTF